MGFDFDAAVAAPHRMQPGLRRLAEGCAQLTPAVAPQRGVARHLREKLAVLGAFAPQALVAVDGFDPTPALDALSAHAATEHPQAWVDRAFSAAPDPCHSPGRQAAEHAPTPQTGSTPLPTRARWHAPCLGWALTAQGEPLATHATWPEVGQVLSALPTPWRLPALLSLAFNEDFAIVDADSGTLPWMAVALPSVWAPEAKVGLGFAQAHAPVADNRLITAAADRLMALVTGPQRWERFVWTLTHHRRLHAHPHRVNAQGWADARDGIGGGASRQPRDGLEAGTSSASAQTAARDRLAAQAWLRTERQTFIPVAGRPQAVFTIAVDTQPLTQAAAPPGRAARLHAALSSMTPAVIAYRGLAPVHAILCDWLADRAQASAPAQAEPVAHAPEPQALRT